MAELARNHDVELVWLPYELRPEPVPLPDTDPAALAAGRAKWSQGVGPLAERFGVTMFFSVYKPRSRLAHEAAEFARDQGRFDAMRVALFKALFVEGQNIGERQVLEDLATRVGLDAAALGEALDAGRYTQRVESLEAFAQQIGVGAVPAMIFGDSVAVEGAQPYTVLRRAYEMALEHEASPAPEGATTPSEDTAPAARSPLA